MTRSSVLLKGRPAGPLAITVRLTRKRRRALARVRRVRVMLTFTATARGLSQSRTARITLRR